MLPFEVKAAELDFSEIYVFGDSLSDTGNFFKASTNIFPPSPPYFEGRFTNGPVWVEYLAENLELTSNPDTNFAFGGAFTGVGSLADSQGNRFLGLQQQIDNFTLANPSGDPDALYVVWAGANDYIGRRAEDPVQPLLNLLDAVTSLTNIGAENILIPNLPDLGKLPATRNTQFSDNLNQITALHNLGLKFTIGTLDLFLKPDVNLVYLNLNPLFNKLITNPRRFGLTNVTDRCLSNTSITGVCSNPDEYLFWDGQHPTTTVHKILGDFATSKLNSISKHKSNDKASEGLIPSSEIVEAAVEAACQTLDTEVGCNGEDLLDENTILAGFGGIPTASSEETSVPEPDSVLGILAFGVFGVTTLLKNKHQ